MPAPSGLAWTPPAEPPVWARQAHEYLPNRPNGSGPTHGQIFSTDGNRLSTGQSIQSGENRALVEDLSLIGAERRADSLLSHVEAQVAATMRRAGGDLPRDVVLVINNAVCAGPLSCRRLLPGILPSGCRLIVYERGPDGQISRQPRIFTGTGERIKG